MKAIILLSLILTSMTIFADTKTGDWVTVSEIEAARLIGDMTFIPRPDIPAFNKKFPDEIPLTTLSGRRGLLGKEAWIFNLPPCRTSDGYCWRDEAIEFIKKSESGISDSELFGHFYLTEESMHLDYNHRKASYYRFTAEMDIRITKKNDQLKVIEFRNSANKLLKIEVKKDHFFYSYQFKNKTYSFAGKKDGDDDFFHKLGEVLALPLMVILGTGC